MKERERKRERERERERIRKKDERVLEKDQCPVSSQRPSVFRIGRTIFLPSDDSPSLPLSLPLSTLPLSLSPSLSTLPLSLSLLLLSVFSSSFPLPLPFFLKEDVHFPESRDTNWSEESQEERERTR